MTEVIKSELTYNILNGEGIMEVRDCFTNAVVTSHRFIDEKELKINARWKYSETLGQIIASEFRKVSSMNKIAEIDGMPPAKVLYQWLRDHEEFKTLIQQARQDRADKYVDTIEAIVDELEDANKDEVPAAKVRLDNLWKLAEKSNPEQYGQKLEVKNNLLAPLQIIVHTGISRDEPPTMMPDILTEATVVEETKSEEPENAEDRLFKVEEK